MTRDARTNATVRRLDPLTSMPAGAYYRVETESKHRADRLSAVPRPAGVSSRVSRPQALRLGEDLGFPSQRAAPPPFQSSGEFLHGYRQLVGSLGIEARCVAMPLEAVNLSCRERIFRVGEETHAVSEVLVDLVVEDTHKGSRLMVLEPDLGVPRRSQLGSPVG